MPLREAMPAERDEADHARDGQRLPGDDQRRDGADRRHRQRGQHLQRQVHRAKQRVERQEHRGERDQAQQADHPRGVLLAFELAAVFDEVAGRQRSLESARAVA